DTSPQRIDNNTCLQTSSEGGEIIPESRGAIISEQRGGFIGISTLYLRTTLDKLTTNKPAIPMKGKNLVFAQPTLIAEIHFRRWTDDGNLRHAPFKGLREVQDNSEIFEMPS
ncbi:hypothetical protein MRBLMR1_003990, partial [Neorhizobium sp. LMR1-1-1.1]